MDQRYPTIADSDAGASQMSDYSARNPVPSATTLSIGDSRVPPLDAQSASARSRYYTCDTDDATSQTHLTAHNPIVTPATSETASVAGGPGSHLADRPARCGLPTVDEVAKAPPEYLTGHGRLMYASAMSLNIAHEAASDVGHGESQQGIATVAAADSTLTQSAGQNCGRYAGYAESADTATDAASERTAPASTAQPGPTADSADELDTKHDDTEG